jgi:hypothetical protein
MSNISISTPFSRKFTHADFTVGVTATNLVATMAPGTGRRITTLIQNKSATATITLILNDTGTVGFTLQPATLFSIDNYAGTIRIAASAASTPVHIAYSIV